MHVKKPNCVKKVREELKITVRELAKLSGMSHSEISDIENFISIPSQESILRLSYALGKESTEVFMLKSNRVNYYFGRNTDQT